MTTRLNPPPRLVSVCINLDRSKDRWTRLQQVLQGFPWPLVRLAATDGLQLTDGDMDSWNSGAAPTAVSKPLVTTQVRWNLQHRPLVCDRALLPWLPLWLGGGLVPEHHASRGLLFPTRTGHIHEVRRAPPT